MNKVLEGRPHCVDAIKSGEIQLVINTTGGGQSVADSFDIRRSALTHGVPHYTTAAGARAAVHAIAALQAGTLDVAPLQSYFSPFVLSPARTGAAAVCPPAVSRLRRHRRPSMRWRKEGLAVQKFPMTAEGLASWKRS